MRAFNPSFVSPTACPKNPTTVAYAVTSPSSSTTVAVPSLIASSNSPAAIEPMHFEAHAVAGLQIGFDCFANGVSGNLKIERCSLHHRERLARDESQLRVQRKGADVITGLKEPNAGNALFCSSRHAVAHQCATNSLILHSRINRDRSDACNRRPLIHKIAANDLVIDFGNDSVKSWICDKLREQSNRYFRRG